MSKTLVLFPGQGSQYPQMANDLLRSDPLFQRLATLVDQQYSPGFLQALVSTDPQEMDHFRHVQFAIHLQSLCLYRRYESILGLPVDGMVGFSLGEFTAYSAANLFSEEEVLSILAKRMLAMENLPSNSGKMVAVMGANETDLLAYCQDLTAKNMLLQIANYNSPQQVVVAGEDQAIALFMEEFPAKRKILLPIQRAFHTPLMQEAAKELQLYVQTLKYQLPKKTIYSNVSARELEIKHIDQVLYQHTTSPVLFRQTIEYCLKQGYDSFVEIGPKNTLTSFIKKIDPDGKTWSIQTLEHLDYLKEELSHGL